MVERLLIRHPMNTWSTDEKIAGKRTYKNPICLRAGGPVAKMSAVAPPGGCRHRNLSIAPMEKDTAMAEQRTIPTKPGMLSPTSIEDATPIVAEMALPMMQFHGCANGAPGAPKINTAWAPKLPINITSLMWPSSEDRFIDICSAIIKRAMAKKEPTTAHKIANVGAGGGGVPVPIHLSK